MGQGGGGLGGVTELVRIHGAREGQVRCLRFHAWREYRGRPPTICGVGVEENFVCCLRCPACLCVCFAGFCDSLLGSRVLIGSILVGRLGRSGAHDQQLGLS